MKKLVRILTLVFSFVVALSLFACNKTTAAKEKITTAEKKNTQVSSTTENNEVEYVKCNHAQYIAAEIDSPVEIEAYVQAHQSWWDNKIVLYLADEDGAYFAYNVTCSETDAAKLTAGTKVRIKGYKTAWEGEVEIAEGATLEILEGETYVAQATDVTKLLGTEDLIDHQNEYAAFKAMVVTSAAIYKWDGSGKQGDDLYFNVRPLGTTTEYTFTVESYLCDKDSDVYKAVEALQVGDIVNLEGFCYWYSVINPHITKCENAVVSHEEYDALEDDSEVVIVSYVQDHQSWWDNKIVLYLADETGAYLAYNVTCSEEDSAKLTAGTKVAIHGYKASWQGEVEIGEGATFEIIESEPYIAQATDVTELLGTDDLIKHQNELVSFKNAEIVKAAIYKWDGSGKEGDDLYFDVKINGNIYTFTVESYLRDSSTDVYNAVEALQVGDIVNLEGYCYWYDGVNPHIISVEKLEK